MYGYCFGIGLVLVFVLVLVLVLILVLVLSRAGNRWRESWREQMSVIVDPAVHKTDGIHETAISKGMFKISLRIGSKWDLFLRIGINYTQNHNKSYFPLSHIDFLIMLTVFSFVKWLVLSFLIIENISKCLISL